MPEAIAEPPEKFLTGRFLTTTPAPRRSGGGLVVAAGATAAGWFTYGPLSTLLDIKAGHVDEIATLGVGIATATLLGARNLIRYACESDQSYNKKLKYAAGAGGVGGLTLGLTAVGAAAAIPSAGVSLVAAAAVAGATMVGGALVGYFSAKWTAKKKCRHGHPGQCCERVCTRCGSLFAPQGRWESIVNRVDAREVEGDRLAWMDVASILHWRGLNYVEAVHIFEQHHGLWDLREVPAGRVPSVSRDRFFEWLEANESKLSDFRGKRPSDHFWRAAEGAVRSDCDPHRQIRRGDLGWAY